MDQVHPMRCYPKAIHRFNHSDVMPRQLLPSRPLHLHHALFACRHLLLLRSCVRPWCLGVACGGPRCILFLARNRYLDRRTKCFEETCTSRPPIRPVHLFSTMPCFAAKHLRLLCHGCHAIGIFEYFCIIVCLLHHCLRHYGCTCTYNCSLEF